MWQGAEARVEVITIPSSHGQPDTKVIKKTRFAKQYRHQELDRKLTRQRTIGEARALHRAKLKGLPVPSLLWVSADTGVIVMSYLRGAVTVKEALWGGVVSEEWLAGEIGRVCALLHVNDLVHGDLTTSNFLYTQSPDTVHLIDFGLATMSNSVEDKAVDLYVLERAIQSTHSVQHPTFFMLCLSAYERHLSAADQKLWINVKKRFEEVRARGRKRL